MEPKNIIKEVHENLKKDEVLKIILDHNEETLLEECEEECEESDSVYFVNIYLDDVMSHCIGMVYDKETKTWDTYTSRYDGYSYQYFADQKKPGLPEDENLVANLSEAVSKVIAQRLKDNRR